MFLSLCIEENLLSRRIEDCSSKQLNTENPKSSQYLCYKKNFKRVHKKHKIPTQEIPQSLSSKIYLSSLNFFLSLNESFSSSFLLFFLIPPFVKESLLYTDCILFTFLSFTFLSTDVIAKMKMLQILYVISQLPATA